MKNKRRKEQRSGIIKYCITTISCLLLFCVAYIYLIFGTDVVINVDNQSAYNPANIDRISVQTIISDAEDKEPGINDPGDDNGGGGSNPPPGIPSDEVPFNSNGEWYDYASGKSLKLETTPITNINIGTGNGSEYLSLYSGLPWDPNGVSYIFDVNTAAKDVIDYVETQSGKKTGLSVAAKFVYEHNFNSSKSNTVTIDGVNCLGVALPPSVYDDSYCNGFKKDSWRSSATCNTNLYNRKVCVILQHKSTNNVVYLPVYKGDAKGHTFPGGAIQTHLKVKGYNSNDNTYTLAIGDKGNQNAVIDFKGLVDLLDDPVSTAEPSNLRDYWRVNVEVCYISSDALKALNEYNVLGFVVW